MARIAPVEPATEEQEEALAKTLRAPGGEALNIFATLAHSPQLMRRMNALGGYFMVHGDLSIRTRELVILRTASVAGSSYEVAQHRWLAERAGLEPEAIAAALDPEARFPWSPEDACVLALTDELLRSDAVSDETWESLRAHFSETQCIELLVLPGFYRMLAGVLNGLQVELDPFLVPDGTR